MTDLASTPAWASGEFFIGDDVGVVRLGFGAMRFPGPGVSRGSLDRDQAMQVLRRAIDFAVRLSDAADS